MINPYRGILLDGKYYNYQASSYRESVGLKNTSTDATTNRGFQVLGSTPESFTFTVDLDSDYLVSEGDTEVGSTFWAGVSRLADLKAILGAAGNSMPLTFVCPYGATYDVVPTGTLDITIWNPDNPGVSSAEFQVTLTLQSQ